MAAAAEMEDIERADKAHEELSWYRSEERDRKWTGTGQAGGPTAYLYNKEVLVLGTPPGTEHIFAGHHLAILPSLARA